MYPSVSICKKYAFETLVFNNNKENIDINQLVQSVQNHSWGLDQQFYFFTHPGAMNRTFPCTTTLGGTTPGTQDQKVPLLVCRHCCLILFYVAIIGDDNTEEYAEYE